MARYGKAFKARAVARLLPPESSSVDVVSQEIGVSRDTLGRFNAAFNTLTGKIIGKVADRANGKGFLSFLRLPNRRTRADRQLHIILDNLSAHKTQAIQEWVTANPRIHQHFTPTSSSWPPCVAQKIRYRTNRMDH